MYSACSLHNMDFRYFVEAHGYYFGESIGEAGYFMLAYSPYFCKSAYYDLYYNRFTVDDVKARVPVCYETLTPGYHGQWFCIAQ